MLALRSNWRSFGVRHQLSKRIHSRFNRWLTPALLFRAETKYMEQYLATRIALCLTYISSWLTTSTRHFVIQKRTAWGISHSLGPLPRAQELFLRKKFRRLRRSFTRKVLAICTTRRNVKVYRV